MLAYGTTCSLYWLLFFLAFYRDRVLVVRSKTIRIVPSRPPVMLIERPRADSTRSPAAGT
jgi:hypothetical protein